MSLVYWISSFLIFNEYFCGLSLAINVNGLTYSQNEARIKRETNSKTGCTAPSQPKNGRWIPLNQNKTIKENEIVDVNTIISYSCDTSYKLSSSEADRELIVCLNDGKWSFPEMPRCQKLCPPMYSTNTTNLKCKKSGFSVPCDKASDGTVLRFTCAPYFEPEGTILSRKCDDGNWDYSKPICIPVCGMKFERSIPLILRRTIPESYNPWMTAIYRRYNKTSNEYLNICGGSLIAPNVILTAATCVTDYSGQPNDKNDYIVAVGKYYRQYQDARDADTAQYSEVESFDIHPNYKAGLQNYLGDIAIVQVKTAFAMSKFVQPICYMDFDFTLVPDMKGVVSGWNIIKPDEERKDVLKELESVYKDYSTCESEFEEDFAKKFHTPDKICSGQFNRSSAICRGDSGSGLMFKNPKNNRYFIKGIVSIGPIIRTSDIPQCDIQKRTLFTKIDYYIDWLQSKLH